MEDYTDFNNAQQPYLKLTDLGQNTHSTHIDFPSHSSSHKFQVLNHFPIDAYQASFDSLSSGPISFSEQAFDQQDVTYDSRLNHYPPKSNWSHQGHASYVPVDDDDLFNILDNSQENFIREQNPFSTNIRYNMAAEIPESSAPTDSENTTGDRPKLLCSVPKCSQDRVFPSESALRKHEAKHSKPYICQVPDCKHTRFGDKGGLDRHNREVHGSKTHCCPFTSCKRHTRGFPRKYILFEHQRRCHSSQSPGLTPQSNLGQQTHVNDTMKRHQASYENKPSSEIVTGGGGRLREKLDNLLKIRAEIDVDIEILKKALDLMGGDTPSWP